jgi:catalase
LPAMDPAEAVDTINAAFGRHPQRRALHAKGLFCEGTFTATPRAGELCRAGHLQGAPVPVRVRVSNGSGNPRVGDGAPDVRGLAVSFELPDGSRSDLVSQSVPRFFSSTPEDFIAFVRASSGRSAAVKLPAFLATHPRALRALPANVAAMRPVASYATLRYYGVHAFRWLDAAGGSRFVRCDWAPEAGDHRLSPLEARKRSRDYLQDEFRERLARGPVRFTLDVQLAGPGDEVDDPAAHWPSTRERVDAGTLEITAVVADPEAGGSIVVFDPMRLTDGIEASQDPVLRFRPRAYSESADRRAVRT